MPLTKKRHTKNANSHKQPSRGSYTNDLHVKLLSMLKVAGRGSIDRDSLVSTKNEDLWGKIWKRASISRSGYSQYACSEVVIKLERMRGFLISSKGRTFGHR